MPSVATTASGSSKAEINSNLNNERDYVGLLYRLDRWLRSMLRCLSGRQAAKAESLGSFTAITDHGLDHAKHPRLLQDFLELLPGKMPNLAAPAHPGLFHLHHDPNMIIEAGIKDASRLPVPEKAVGLLGNMLVACASLPQDAIATRGAAWKPAWWVTTLCIEANWANCFCN